MTIDINSLRNRRKTNIEAIAKSFTEKGQKQSYDDDRYWKLEAGKDGNGAALIRFLDITPDSEDTAPHVHIWKYGFKVNGRWYIEKSLQSIGQDDPVYDLNGELWKLAQGDKKSPYAEQAQNQRRVAEYHANILVKNDPKNPDNNGKVFLFKFGNQIMKKITAKISPSDEQVALGVVPVTDLFDYWTGRDFRLVMTTEDVDFGEGSKPTPSYEASAFDETPKPVADTDEKILAIAKQQYSLSELLDPKHFKTYEQLAKRLDWVLNGKSSKPDEDGGGDDGGEDTPAPEERKAEPKKAGRPPKREPEPTPEGEGEPSPDEQDASEYLRGLMKKK